MTAPQAPDQSLYLAYAYPDHYLPGTMLYAAWHGWFVQPNLDVAFRTYVTALPTATPTATGTATMTPSATITPSPIGTSSPAPVTPSPTATPATSTPTATATLPPVREDDDDDGGKKQKQTREQRQPQERTNDANLDQYRSEGNVASVEQVGSALVVTLALGRGETLTVVYQCPGGACPSVGYGDYIEVEGELGDDGRFYADTLDR